MKKTFLIATGILVAATFLFVTGADHIDAPEVGTLAEGSSLSDITDFHAFESPENPNNYVFVCSVLGLTAPSETAAAQFNEDIMYEFNIDIDADQVEDLVIQTVFRDDKVIVLGPIAPSTPGRDSQIENTGLKVEAPISKYGESIAVAENNGIKVFAGPRDDPFFFDFFQFVDIVNGVAKGTPDGNDPTAFNSPGQDTFMGTNVLSIVIELPKDLIGGTSTTTFGSWLESKTKM